MRAGGTQATSRPERERRPSPSAPAKNREASTMLASLFFVSAHKDSATRHGCAPRSACRGASACQWHANYEPTEAAGETKSFCPCQKTGENTGFSPVFFLNVLHGYSVHFGSDSWFSHPASSATNRCYPSPAPKTHPVSPFSAQTGCVSLFLSSFDLQNFRGWFLQSVA